MANEVTKEDEIRANNIIEKAINRAIPGTGAEPEAKSLETHQKEVLRGVMRKGIKQEVSDGKHKEVLDALEPAFGRPGELEKPVEEKKG